MTDNSSFAVGRRSVLAAGLLTAPVTALAAQQGQPMPMPIAARPSPFTTSGLPGLSGALLTSHYANNYVGAVRRLGAIQTELGATDMSTIPGFRLNGLKREELIAWNSKLLHEIYFQCLATATATAAAPSARLAQAIELSFGSHDRWRDEFVAMGKALAGGSGWVLLTWSPFDGRLVNAWASDHTHTLAGGLPLVALDMYEHAYAMDYGAKAAAYVDAYMGVLDWAYANRMFSAAVAA